jgi:hypothetical protein
MTAPFSYRMMPLHLQRVSSDMRSVLFVLMLMPNWLWAASAGGSIESLSAQMSPFWQTLKPACVMALEPNVQSAITPRIQFLDTRLVGNQLEKALAEQSRDRSAQWASPVWSTRDTLEKSALKLKDRESLREYFFKLQTQTPNPERTQLVADIQHMSEQLNFVLRKELWKTCHALGLSQIPVAQLETAVEQRWLMQQEKVRLQLKRELAAFYFYSFRQTDNAQLKGFADVAKGLNPWVESTSLAISEHFAQLREQLLAVPLEVTLDVIDEPFPADRPWPPSPSSGLLQP